MALAVDYLVQLAVISPLVLPAVIVSSSSGEDAASLPSRLIQNGVGLVGLLALLIPAGMAWIDWKGWRTPGRYLLQLRVVGDHGLRLSPNTRLIPGFIRNAPVWLAAITIVSLPLAFSSLSHLLGPVDEILFFVNAVPILGPMRRTLHDRICGSNVVLDTTK